MGRKRIGAAPGRPASSSTWSSRSTSKSWKACWHHRVWADRQVRTRRHGETKADRERKYRKTDVFAPSASYLSFPPSHVAEGRRIDEDAADGVKGPGV